MIRCKTYGEETPLQKADKMINTVKDWCADNLRTRSGFATTQAEFNARRARRQLKRCNR